MIDDIEVSADPTSYEGASVELDLLDDEAISNAPDEVRIAALRKHLGYIIANVTLAFLLLFTGLFWTFGRGLMQTWSVPMYVPPMAVLLEIGLLLVMGYWQHTYSKRFRIGTLISGIITILEAGVVFFYAHPSW